MPGIAGIIQEREKNELLSYVEGLSQELIHNSTEKIDRKAFNGAAFIQVYSPYDKSNFAVSDDGSLVLLYFGKVYDDNHLKQRLLTIYDTGGDTSNQAELFLRCYTLLGRDSLCGLNGIYVIVIWDSLEKKLTIINDRYGFRKLYYWHRGNKFIFATEVNVICCDSDYRKTVDDAAVANLITFGYLLNDRTLFKDTKLLPRASILTYNCNETLIGQYWDYSFHCDDEPIRLEEYYVDSMAEVIERAIRKRANGVKRLAVPLSGGLDSRVIVGMLKKIGFSSEIISYSYGNKNCFDVRYGAKIAQKLHYPHYFLPIDSDYLKKYSDEFIKLSDGMISCLNAHMCVSKNFVQEMGYDIIATGFLGDIQTGVLTISKKIIGLKNTEDVILALFKAYSAIMTEEELKIYLREYIYNQIAGLNYDAFRVPYLTAPTENKFFLTRYIGLIHRQRRYTTFNIYCHEDYTEVMAPFTDNEVVDFNLHIPAAMSIGQNIYKKMIVKYLPAIARVPYNVTRRPLKENWLRDGLQWRWEGLIRNPLIRATIGRRYAKMNDNYLNTHEAISTGSRDFVIKHIKDNPFLAEYLNMDRVHQLLDDHLEGKANEHGKITALLTLSLWHKLFIEGKGFKAVQNE